ncbi:MAG TPA: condensation domain-containing protein, partial [Anaerolineae bacterium]
MTVPVADLMSQLRNLDIRLWTEGDRLRYSAPPDALTPELWAKLVERKADILAFLHQVDMTVRIEAPPIEASPRSGDLPLSFAQQRLWFLDQLAPERPTYNLPNAFHLIGPLNVEALAQSLSEIVRRHEALRTTFEVKDGQPVQIIGPAPQSNEAWPISLVDCRHLPETEREDEARRLAAEEARQPFKLAQGPLLRVTLLQLGQTNSILLLTIHHIISDGWSMAIFTRELAGLYEAYTVGQHPALPDPSIQYVDFARWQRQWLQGSRLETQLAYWKQQLGGRLPILQLSGDHPRPANQSFRGARHSLTLPTALVDALRQISRQHDSTLFMTLLAAFNILLYRYSGQEDLIVGSPIANRNRSEIENLIGFFVNTLALRTDLSGNPTFLELLARVRQMSLEAYAHQDLPFERLVEVLQP